MNSTQLQTTLGPILGLVAGYFAAWWGIDQADALGILTALIGVGYAVYNAVITRKSGLISQVAQGGTQVITKDQSTADALPNNPNVMGPQEAKVVQQ